MRRFAISDIHGCAFTFKLLVEELIRPTKEDQIFLLGDYIDRGPDSKKVFDHIFRWQEAGLQIYCLLGNHEDMLLDSLTDMEQRRHWLKMGGTDTLKSFGVDRPEDIPEKYLRFMKDLPYYIELGDYFLVHAGFNFCEGKEKLYQDTESMLWIRNWHMELLPKLVDEKTVLHGHTPSPRHLLQELLIVDTTVINIDSGCAYDYHGLGHLCAFDMNNLEYFFMLRKDKMPPK